jgi:hypothetical protein
MISFNNIFGSRKKLASSVETIAHGSSSISSSLFVFRALLYGALAASGFAVTSAILSPVSRIPSTKADKSRWSHVIGVTSTMEGISTMNACAEEHQRSLITASSAMLVCAELGEDDPDSIAAYLGHLRELTESIRYLSQSSLSSFTTSTLTPADRDSLQQFLNFESFLLANTEQISPSVKRSIYKLLNPLVDFLAKGNTNVDSCVEYLKKRESSIRGIHEHVSERAFLAESALPNLKHLSDSSRAVLRQMVALYKQGDVDDEGFEDLAAKISRFSTCLTAAKSTLHILNATEVSSSSKSDDVSDESVDFSNIDEAVGALQDFLRTLQIIRQLDLSDFLFNESDGRPSLLYQISSHFCSVHSALEKAFIYVQVVLEKDARFLDVKDLLQQEFDALGDVNVDDSDVFASVLQKRLSEEVSAFLQDKEKEAVATIESAIADIVSAEQGWQEKVADLEVHIIALQILREADTEIDGRDRRSLSPPSQQKISALLTQLQVVSRGESAALQQCSGQLAVHLEALVLNKPFRNPFSHRDRQNLCNKIRLLEGRLSKMASADANLVLQIVQLAEISGTVLDELPKAKPGDAISSEIQLLRQLLIGIRNGVPESGNIDLTAISSNISEESSIFIYGAILSPEEVEQQIKSSLESLFGVDADTLAIGLQLRPSAVEHILMLRLLLPEIKKVLGIKK